MTKTELLLVCLMEECAEVQHAASKVLRFGPGNSVCGVGPSNKEQLEKELDDLAGVIYELREVMGLKPASSIEAMKKINRLQYYMRISETLGNVES